MTVKGTTATPKYTAWDGIKLTGKKATKILFNVTGNGMLYNFTKSMSDGKSVKESARYAAKQTISSGKELISIMTAKPNLKELQKLQ